MLYTLSELDGNILLWIQDNIRNEFLTPIITFITNLGNKGFLWVLLCLILLIPKKRRSVGIIGIISLCLSLVVNNAILKNFVARTRPYELVNGLIALIPYPTDFSFPSGHTAASFAAAVVFYKELPRKYGIPALVVAVLIALSRLYLGVHYPSDVLAGAVSGTLLALLACKIGSCLREKGFL